MYSLMLLKSELCRGNGMTKPPKEALADLQSVRVISLDYNNLTKLGRLLREFVLSIISG